MGSIDDVRDRLTIDQVVGEVVQLKRAGNSLKGLCPFHTEKSPSFIVTPSRGMYKCFGCGESGDMFTFVMKTRSMQFHDALVVLAGKAGVTLDERVDTHSVDETKLRFFDMNASAATYFQSLLSGASGTEARAYLNMREVKGKTIEQLALGFASDSRDGLGQFLRDKGFSDAELIEGGLMHAADERGPTRDRFYNRLIFPIRDGKGRIVGFGGRLLHSGEPKYLNSPATTLFDKSRVLYGIDHAINSIRSAHEGIIVEGYFDVLRAHQAGFGNVVATLGTAITEDQLRAISRLTTRIILALDPDPAGQKAAIRAGFSALSALPSSAAITGGRRDAVQVFVARLPQGKDPDETIAADPELWRKIIADAVPLMDHYFELVSNELDREKPVWRQEAIDILIPAIGALDGLGAQQEYIERLSALTGVDARYLRDLTPGQPPTATRRRDNRTKERERAQLVVDGAPSQVDLARVTEEYILGLLLLQPTLQPETRTLLAAYQPLTVELTSLFEALAVGKLQQSMQDETVERLINAAQGRPALPPGGISIELQACVARMNDERARRQLREMATLGPDLDPETNRELDQKTADMIMLKEQYTARLQKEQSLRWRSGSTDSS